jgi:hypothetical protein
MKQTVTQLLLGHEQGEVSRLNAAKGISDQNKCFVVKEEPPVRNVSFGNTAYGPLGKVRADTKQKPDTRVKTPNKTVFFLAL